MIEQWLWHLLGEMPNAPWMLGWISGIVLLVILIKTGIYMLARFKRFPGAILTSALGTIAGAGLIFAAIYFQWHPLPRLLWMAGAGLLACQLADFIAVLVTSRGKYIFDGLLGAAISGLFIASTMLFTIILKFYPLA